MSRILDLKEFRGCLRGALRARGPEKGDSGGLPWVIWIVTCDSTRFTCLSCYFHKRTLGMPQTTTEYPLHRARPKAAICKPPYLVDPSMVLGKIEQVISLYRLYFFVFSLKIIFLWLMDTVSKVLLCCPGALLAVLWVYLRNRLIYLRFDSVYLRFHSRYLRFDKVYLPITSFS